MNSTEDTTPSEKKLIVKERNPAAEAEIKLRESKILLHKSVVVRPNPNEVLFVPSTYESESSQFIENRMSDTKWFYSLVGLQFYSTADILKRLCDDLDELLAYRFPGAKLPTDLNKDDLFSAKNFNIYQSAVLGYGVDVNEAALLRYTGQVNKDFPDHYVFQHYRLTPLNEHCDFSYLIPNFPTLVPPKPHFSLSFPTYNTVDERFDIESKELMDEIRERISRLRKMGVNDLVLSGLLNYDQKLSRLHITKDYRIFLPDFNNLEIKMGPLPKAVFLLFLRHEEGIAFKCLSDHTDELIGIYNKISNRSSKETILDSILAITDPTNNSINEKCARVREAFVQHFDERIAQHYFITGARGEAKKIGLSRDLIDFECAL